MTFLIDNPWWGAATGARQRTLGPWQARTSGFGTSTIRGLAYGDGVWVAVGDGGKISRSTNDGQTWAAVTSSFGTTAINSVAWGDGVFVAVGAGGKAARSADGGVTWAQVAGGISTNVNLACVAYGNGYFICAGKTSATSVTYRIMKSNLGGNWSGVSPGLGNVELTDIYSGGGSWVLVGYNGLLALSINDGSTWTSKSSNISTYIGGVGFDGDVWVSAGSNHQISRSIDGGNVWSLVSSGGGQINKVCHGDGLWVSAGAAGLVALSSDSGETWSDAASPTSGVLLSVGYGDDTFVIAGVSGYLATASWS